MRNALTFVFIFGLALSSQAASFARDVQPFLKQHCLKCHGTEKQKGRIRLDQLKEFKPSDGHLWTLVYEMLSAGEMPPEDEARPGKAAVQRLLGWIETEQAASRAGHTRRLNRRELSAALQDLTGLKVDYAYMLPADGKMDGFDTGATALQDAADSVARAMEVTRRAVEGIRFLEPARGTNWVSELRNIKDPRRTLDNWKKTGGYFKARGVNHPEGLLMEPQWLGSRNGCAFTLWPPADGRGVLRFRMEVSAFEGKFKDLPHPRLWVKAGGRLLGSAEITASSGKPKELIYHVQVNDLPLGKRGLEVKLQPMVEMPYAVKGFENEDRKVKDKPVPGGTGLYRPLWDRKKKPPVEETPAPYLTLHAIEAEMDYVAQWPPAEWGTNVGEIVDNDTSAKRLLGIWMERAWRRPVSRAEQKPFFALYQKVRKQGASFDEALRAAFHSVLMSAPFRYLSPVSQSHHAIASRLSFMLIGAPPDAALRQLAKDNKLRDAKVLDVQVDRLLADPRSDGFVRPFVRQWLVMGQPITLAMKTLQHQDFRFGRYLKESMQEETIAYVAQMLKDNRPARELIDSDWTMMNDSLARHYGYDGFDDGVMRKVTLRRNDPRGGGLLGHAGIQSMLTWMGDNWVIYRGAWTLRHILDSPPPPPPLEVPVLDPTTSANQGKSFKELLVQHQEDARCAICHKDIDPLGFAFQNFDLSGRWRDVEFEKYKREEIDGKIAWNGAGKSRPVDAAGQLPRGETFKSFEECKQLLVKNYQADLVHGLLKNLTLYGTGRKPDVAGLGEIRDIQASLRAKGYRLSDLVKAVVRSEAFLGDR